MDILSKNEILIKGKEFSVDIGFDPYTGIYIDMATETPYNGIGYTLFSNGEIESYTYFDYVERIFSNQIVNVYLI